MGRSALIAAALLLAACGSTVDQQEIATARADGGLGPGLAVTSGATTTTIAGASPATSAPTAAGAVRPGATGSGSAAGAATPAADVPPGEPIEIGFVRTGVSNAAAFGASLGNTVTESAVLDALVKSFNEHGGIAGHEIVPVFADTDTASSSWDSDFAAACATFTEDHHVAAVLGYVFTYLEAFEACLAEDGVPHLSTSFNIPDATTMAQYPLWVALSTPLIERRSVAKIDGGLATGVLTPDSRIGVVVDPCPGSMEAWEQVTKPYLEAHDLEVASVFEVGCAHGSGDAGAEAGRAGSLVLQFRSDGVDTVMFMSVAEGPPLLIFANAAESQAYRPSYVVSSLANAAVLGSQIPAAQAANVHGFGWLPNQDVPPAAYPPLSASAERCVAMLAEQGIELKAAVDHAYAFNSCDALFLYEQALTGTGGDVDGAGVVAAVEALGAGYVSAMNLGGRAVFGSGRRDGPALARSFTWVDECSCFRYGGTDVPIG